MNWFINKNFFQIVLLSAAVAGTLNPRSYKKNRIWDQKQDHSLQINDKGKSSNFISIISAQSKFCFTISFYDDKY